MKGSESILRKSDEEYIDRLTDDTDDGATALDSEPVQLGAPRHLVSRGENEQTPEPAAAPFVLNIEDFDDDDEYNGDSEDERDEYDEDEDVDFFGLGQDIIESEDDGYDDDYDEYFDDPEYLTHYERQAKPSIFAQFSAAVAGSFQRAKARYNADHYYDEEVNAQRGAPEAASLSTEDEDSEEEAPAITVVRSSRAKTQQSAPQGEAAAASQSDTQPEKVRLHVHRKSQEERNEDDARAVAAMFAQEEKRDESDAALSSSAASSVRVVRRREVQAKKNKAVAAVAVQPVSRKPSKGYFSFTNFSAVLDAAGSLLLDFGSLAGSVPAIGRGIGMYMGSAPASIWENIRAIPSRIGNFFKTHSLSRWVRSRTKKQWGQMALATAGALVVIIVVSVVLAADWALSSISYVDPDSTYASVSISDITNSDFIAESELSASDVLEDEVTSSSDLKGFTDDMIDIDEDDVLNILLLGTDSRSSSYVQDNSDTMILCSINLKDKNIKLTSFMRDSYVKIPGYGSSRLNAAFAYGGPELLFKTLETNFGVKVDKYVRVNFSAFIKVVNTIGGVEIELDEAEVAYMTKYSKVYKTKPVKLGVNTLDGNQALSYARIRKIDSDFNRTQRQRKVLQAIAEKCKSSSVLTLTKLVSEILPLVETNLTKEEIVSLIPIGLQCISKDIETLNVPIKGGWSNKTVGKAQVLGLNFTLNKKAIKAHIYSTWQLDIEDQVMDSYVYKDTTPVNSLKGSSSNKTTAATTTTTSAATTSSSASQSTTTSTKATQSTTSSKVEEVTTTTTSAKEEVTTTTTTTTTKAPTTTTTTTKAPVTTTTTKAAETPPPAGEEVTE